MWVERLKGILRKVPSTNYAIIALVVLFSLISPVFFSVDNMINIMLQGSVLAILAFGMTMAIISRGIDLSLGAVASLAGVICAISIRAGLSIYLAIFNAVLVGICCGTINGTLIGYFRMIPFIATLGMMCIGEGLGLVLSKGGAVPVFHPFIQNVGGGFLCRLPIPIWVALLIFLLAYVLLKKTIFGIHIYAIGGNQDAAALSGINVVKRKIALYAINGFLASIAGIVLSGRMYTAHPSGGIGMEFDAVAASVIGGTALSGGRGGVTGTVMGVAIVSIIRSGLNIAGLPASWQMVALGSIITITIALDSFRRNLEKRWIRGEFTGKDD